jgi:hypothetical protein
VTAGSVAATTANIAPRLTRQVWRSHLLRARPLPPVLLRAGVP